MLASWSSGWPSVVASACYTPPVASPIVDHFREPTCAYCAGNRGLEYQPAPGTAVVAAFAGTVTFSGSVAGIAYVVVQQVDGRTATYGRLQEIDVAVGQKVLAASVVGRSTARLYFGIRDGERYVDPEPFVGVASYRPRLIPVDGGARRASPPPRISCASSPLGR